MSSRPPTAVDAALRYRAQLLARDARRAAEMTQAYGLIWRDLQDRIAALLSDIEAGRERRYLEQRLSALARQVEVEVSRYGAYADGQVAVAIQEAVGAAAGDAANVVRAAYGPMGDAVIRTAWNRLPTEAVETALGMLSGDSPLRTRMTATLGQATADAVRDKLLIGIAEGWNPRKIQNELRRTFGQGLEWSLTATRTAELYAYREATRANYAANSDVVKGWRWVATKDPRTCMSCIVMDGTVHPLSETLNDHHNGRCAASPVVASYRELGIDVDGPAQPHEPARSWFEGLPEATQRQMMGDNAYEAWRGGKFDLRDYTVEYIDSVYGVMRRQATIKELLREIDSAA